MCRKLVLSAISVLFGGLLLAQPTITSFTPQSGVVGSTVTIVGTGFNTTAANNVVIFGATRATVTAATGTQLTVTVPIGATYAPISVLNTATGLLVYSRGNFTPTFVPVKNGVAAEFQPKVDFASGIERGPVETAQGDLDGDGRLDLAVTSSAGASIFRNISTVGSINYAPKVDFATGLHPRSVAIGDLDGDGKLDFVVVNGNSCTVSVFRNISNGAGSIDFAPKMDFETGLSPISIGIGDLDGDGRTDMVVANNFNRSLSVFRNTGHVGIINFVVTGSIHLGIDSPRSLTVDDLNSDGRPDVAVTTSSNVGIFRNTSRPGFIQFATRVNVGCSNSDYIKAGDFDNDGKTDLATAGGCGSNSISILRNIGIIGSISYAFPLSFWIDGGSANSLAIGDLNGDGKLDILANMSNNISILRNTSSINNVDFVGTGSFSGFGSGKSILIGDLDGDEKPDLLSVGVSIVSTLRNAPSSQTITFAAIAPKQYGLNLTLTGTATSGLPVSYTSSNPGVATISGSIVTITGAGTTVITASQPGNATWAAAVPVQQTLVVTKAPLTATASNAAKVYGTANPTFSFSYSGFVNGENASVLDSPPTVGSAATNCSNVGTYPITLSGGVDNNYTIVAVNGTLTVNKANLTVTADNKSKTYNTPNPALTFSYSGFVCLDNASVIDVAPTVSTSATTTSNAGTYPITLSGGSDNNYNLNLVNGTLTINKANQTISFSPIPTLCTYATHSLVASSSSGLPITFSSSDVTKATISGSTLTAVAHGTPTITATQAGNVNFNPASASQVVTINPNPTASISGGSTVCFGATTTLTAQPGGSGFTYVWSTGATSQTISVGSGTYTVTVYKSGCSGTSSTFVEGIDCSGGGGDPCPDPYNPNCPCTGRYCARLKGIPNNDIPADFIDKSPGIYPNPAVTDYFILLEEPGAEATQVTMTDVSGKVVRQTQIEERMWAKKVNVADLPTGLYVVRLTQNNKSLYYRLLISR